MIERSFFDEPFLGVKCYRVKLPILKNDIEFIRALNSEKAFFIDAKVETSDLKHIDQLVELGFSRICLQVVLSRRLSNKEKVGNQVKFSDTLELSNDQILAHASHFAVNRFRQDPSIEPTRSIALYAQWIRNSISGKKKVVSINANFCTYDDCGDERKIDLLSVLERRVGYASALLSALAEDAREKGLNCLKTQTELKNEAALHLYLKAGFTPSAHYICFHLSKLLPQAPEHY